MKRIIICSSLLFSAVVTAFSSSVLIKSDVNTVGTLSMVVEIENDKELDFSSSLDLISDRDLKVEIVIPTSRSIRPIKTAILYSTSC